MKRTMLTSKFPILLLVLISLIIVETYVIIKQQIKIKRIEENLPVLLKGEPIKYFDLYGIDDHKINSSILSGKEYNVIFIFDQPCSICTQNIAFWKKIKKFMGNKIPVYGVVLSEYENMVNYAKQGMLNFDIYFPIDREKFIENFRLKMNLAQTIILNKNKVLYIHQGTLNAKSFSYILSQLKNLVNGRMK